MNNPASRRSRPANAIATLFAAAALAAAIPGVALAADPYKWVTSTPGGAKAGQQTYVVHGSPRDLTDFDVHLACVPGQASVTFGARIRGFGRHKPEALRGQAAAAAFLVDGRRVAAREMKLTAWDEGVEMAGEFGDVGGLLDAMEKGKSVRIDLPGMRTPAIALQGFAALSRDMRRHCRLDARQ